MLPPGVSPTAKVSIQHGLPVRETIGNSDAGLKGPGTTGSGAKVQKQ
jgi:hypothetical protein